MRVLVLGLLCWLCLLGTSSGAFITLEGSQQLEVVGNTDPPPTTVHFGDFEVTGVMPSGLIQSWDVPVEYLVSPLEFGLGEFTTKVYPFVLPSGDVVSDFVPDNVTLTLRWYYRTADHSLHRLEWEAEGEGVIVSESSEMALGSLAMTLLLLKRNVY